MSSRFNYGALCGKFTQSPWTGADLLTIYETDYKPHLLNTSRGPKRAPPALSKESGTGQSMVVSVLERNKDPRTNEAGPHPCSLPALKKPSTRRPSQDVLSGPSGHIKLPSPSSSVRHAVHSMKDSSSRALSCTKAASLTTPAVVLSSTSSPPGNTKTGQEDASVKETMQVVKETVADTSRVPHLGSCQGSRPLLQKRTDRQRDNSYEDFLKNLYLSNKMESQLNSYLISQSTYSSKGVMSQENFSTYLNHFDAQKERFKHREPHFPNKLSLPRILRVSEYADKFGFLQKAYPPRIPQDTKPAPVSSRIAFPATLLKHGGYDTEYQANYGGQLQTCPGPCVRTRPQPLTPPQHS